VKTRYIGISCVSPLLPVGFPVVELDRLCVVMSHQVLDMETTIRRLWFVYCILYTVIACEACSFPAWLFLGGSKLKYIDVNDTKLPKLNKYYLNTFSINPWTTKNMFDESVHLVYDPASRGNIS
jgi:hypothetical protein